MMCGIFGGAAAELHSGRDRSRVGHYHPHTRRGILPAPDTVTLAADGYSCHYQTLVWDILGWLRRPN